MKDGRKADRHAERKETRKEGRGRKLSAMPTV